IKRIPDFTRIAGHRNATQLDTCAQKPFTRLISAVARVARGPHRGGKMPAVSRRGFFNGMFGASALTASTLTEVKMAFAQSVQTLGEHKPRNGWDNDDGYWAKVRDQFMLEPGFAYLNTGTLGPTPRPVVTAMNEYWRLMAVNPNENSQIFQDRQERSRVKDAAFIGAAPDEVAITRNTTEGTTILVHGLDMTAGDEVLVTK